MFFNEVHFRLFVPNADFLTANLFALENQNCNMQTTGRFATNIPTSVSASSGQELVSCSTYNCIVYHCSIEAGLQKDQELNPVINLNFQAKEAREVEEINRYLIRTLGRKSISVNPADFVHQTTEMFSLEVSLALQVKSAHA